MELSVQSLQDLKTRLPTALDDAQFSIRFAQVRQAAYNSKRYTFPTYKVGDDVFLSLKLFTTAASRVQPSHKLGVTKYDPFKIIELIGDNAVRLQLPPNIRTHPVVHVEHTARVRRQPSDISEPQPQRPTVFIDDAGDLVVEMDKILSHRRLGRGFQFLTLHKKSPDHESEWKPLRNFVDHDLTIIASLHEYIKEHDILHHLH